MLLCIYSSANIAQSFDIIWFRFFSADPNYASDDFVFGSSTLAYTGNSTHSARFFFDKSKSSFRAGASNSNTWDDVNVGVCSFAAGYGSKASGSASTAFDRATNATGTSSFATGFSTNATGNYSLASGYMTYASGKYSTAIGINSTASGEGSMAIGNESQATANYAYAIGRTAVANQIGAVSIGWQNENTGVGALALGYGSDAIANYSVSIGRQNVNNGLACVAIGYNNTIASTESGSYAIGNNINIDNASNAVAIGNNVRGYYDGQVIMADNSGAQFWRGATNSFAARFADGYNVYTNSNESSGVFMNSGANSWSSMSDSTKKRELQTS